MTDDWQPAASFDIIKSRARLLNQIRTFMAQRGVLEVETYLLGHTTVTDTNIHSFTTRLQHPGSVETEELFMQSSPEYAMKRLLAAGSGAIYQITRVFRNGEIGRLHNPEFTMLEWYQPGYDHQRLMDELGALLRHLQFGPASRRTYADVFREKMQIDPHRCDLEGLNAMAHNNGLHREDNNRSVLLDYLFSHCIVPALGVGQPEFIYNYPASQAALARLSETDPPVAERFELFIDGMEIANGFHELCDAEEQRNRFNLDNVRRQAAGQPTCPVDEKFLAALTAGLPDCSGVAVGLDRLLMTIHHCAAIRETLAFPVDRA
jgi:elongation factor P--(R)-beta-lysine ligase